MTQFQGTFSVSPLLTTQFKLVSQLPSFFFVLFFCHISLFCFLYGSYHYLALSCLFFAYLAVFLNSNSAIKAEPLDSTTHICLKTIWVTGIKSWITASWLKYCKPNRWELLGLVYKQFKIVINFKFSPEKFWGTVYVSFIEYVSVNPTFTIYGCKPRMKVLLPYYLDMNLDCNQVVISLDKNLATFCHICRYSRQLFFHHPILSHWTIHGTETPCCFGLSYCFMYPKGR